jgi:hypothetical protein
MTTISLLWTLLGLGCLLFSQLLYAESSSVEYKIKAGYLYNFTKFVTWPEDNSDTFNICILGDDPFGALLNPIEKRTASGRPIRLIRLHNLTALKNGAGDNLNKLQNCHILFSNSSVNHSVFKNAQVLQVINNALTVGEGEMFAVHGGMIGFVNRQGKIKLQINLTVIKQSGLKVSAKLLEVAELVEEGSHD